MFDPRAYPVRFSQLKRIAESPKAYLHHLRRDVSDENDETKATRCGKAVHSRMLGGPPVVRWEGERRQGKEWERFAAEHAGSIILSRKEHTLVTNAVGELLTHPVAAPLLDTSESGEAEREIAWWLGRRQALSHVDLLDTEKRRVVELKTSWVPPTRFARYAVSAAYHAQVAFYVDAAASTGAVIESAWIVSVCMQPPHDVVVYEVTPRALEEGRKLYRLWLERLAACEASNAWPGYCESSTLLDVETEVELDFGGLEESEEAAQ